MSFLDNLENSLKNLETGNERGEAGREQRKRNEDRARQAAVAPWAERLKKSSFTEELLKAATREGFKQRTKVYISWIGEVLRLDAKERRMELRPAPDGVNVVYQVNAEETGSQVIDLEGDPAELAQNWLKAA